MKPWYRNSTLQMDDPEMEWLQSKDPASCAIWEWLKSDCQKRDTNQLRTLSPQEMECVCRRLGVSLPTFSQVSQNLQKVGWVVDGVVKGWKKWNERNRTPEEDALRKQVEYWKQRYDAKEVTKDPEKPPQFLPKPPRPPQSEETRGEERRVQHTPEAGGIDGFRKQLNTAFNRKDSDHWTCEEEHLLCSVFKRESPQSELVELLRHKTERGKFFPQSVYKLLDGWTSALDSARNGHGNGINPNAFKEFGTREQSEAMKKSEQAELARMEKIQRRQA